MDINITTPSLLFPAISLLLLAYTNRFLALTSVIRQLHSKYRSDPDPNYLQQIKTLRSRLHLIRHMQTYGVLSLLLCTACMFAVFFAWLLVATVIFSASLLSMLLSLVFSLLEINQSIRAIDLQLNDIERSEIS